MPRSPPPLPPEQLYPRRLAARALAQALDGYELGSVTRKFNADDPAECFGAGTEFYFGAFSPRWEPVARVYLDGPATAQVVIEDVFALVRTSHLHDFGPEEAEALGIHAGRINVTVDLTDIIEQDGDLMRSAPQRILPPGAGPRRGLTVRTLTRGTRWL